MDLENNDNNNDALNGKNNIVSVVPNNNVKDLTENQDWWKRLFGFAFLSEDFRKEINKSENSEDFSDILIASKEYENEPENENENKKVKIINIENGKDGKPIKITFSVNSSQMEDFKQNLENMGLKIVENESTKHINDDKRPNCYNNEIYNTNNSIPKDHDSERLKRLLDQYDKDNNKVKVPKEKGR